MKNPEKGAASINIELKDSKITVRHSNSKGKILFTKDAVYGDWDKIWETIRSEQPKEIEIGKRIKLLKMIDDPHPVPVGTEGVIKHVGGGVINVDWDNGRKIGLVIGFDKYEILN